MLRNRTRKFGRTRRGGQRSAEETNVGVGKVADVVDSGRGVKPAVGQATKEKCEGD